MAGLKNFIATDTPLEVNVKYKRDKGDLFSNPTLYHKLVGSLAYLTVTRPDISYVVHQVSQFITSLRQLHMIVVHRIIRYLLSSHTCGLLFPNDYSSYL